VELLHQYIHILALAWIACQLRVVHNRMHINCLSLQLRDTGALHALNVIVILLFDNYLIIGVVRALGLGGAPPLLLLAVC
jgi:hypothetical protein